jgi:SPOR domain
VTEYFYNTRTNQVEEGRQSDWSQLMGPYATREEAAQALEKARARNDAWDAQDEQE